MQNLVEVEREVRSVPTVVVVDDHPVFRAGVRQYLSTNHAFQIVAEAGDGRAALQLCSRYNPDLVVLDLHLPELTGLEVLRELAAQRSGSKVLILSGEDDPEFIRALLEAGAAGYVFKGSLGGQLLEAAQSVMRGQVWLTPQLAGQLFCPKPTRTGQFATQEHLTPREIEILTLLALGLSNDEIGEKLCLCKSTIQNHVSTIYSKINVSSRAKAVVYALQHNLVRRNDLELVKGK